ncbi:hypothetical protein PoB_005918400 [Plakobranchus ocellatus]|uniref:Uncharacterized protein n=1 Tax=Plakobranchus ocellatus TaxID=259542 RepID=A0AAV4CMM9_9GAST|nr:hypothetical protein PoB_005918400 [Plakobranchus ocellatus]
MIRVDISMKLFRSVNNSLISLPFESRGAGDVVDSEPTLRPVATFRSLCRSQINHSIVHRLNTADTALHVTTAVWIQTPSPAHWLDGAPENLRSTCCGYYTTYALKKRKKYGNYVFSE